MPEWLPECLRITGLLSVSTPAADFRQPVAGLGRRQEVWFDVPLFEHTGAGQQQHRGCGRHSGKSAAAFPQPAQH